MKNTYTREIRIEIQEIRFLDTNRQKLNSVLPPTEEYICTNRTHIAPTKTWSLVTPWFTHIFLKIPEQFSRDWNNLSAKNARGNHSG